MEREKLISEAIQPAFEGAGEAPPVPTGEPLIPGAFVWRGTSYPVLRVLESSREVGPCTHGSGEQYVRKHWYRIETIGGQVFRVYFERRPRRGGTITKRWWLYSVSGLSNERLGNGSR